MGRVDELQAELRALATRGDLARLRIPIIQDFLSGILGGSPDVQQPAAVPHRAEVARPVIDASAPEWPPRVGTYDPAGRAVRVGELAKLGLAFTFEEVRAFILGLAQPAPLSSNGLVQVGRAASALVGELAALALSPADYRAAWRRLFGQPLPVSIGPQLSNIAPPAIASTSDAGGSTEASRSNHTHAHGDQAGGALHALATGGAGPAGFMAPAQVDKLASIAAGATNTPLSNTAPPSIAAASAAGALTEASRADHTHAHGSQAGGALHALATGGAGPAGFMAPAQVDKLAGIATGATNTPLSNTAPPSIAAASAAGALTEASRTDHTHAHGSQAGGALHALATGGAGPAGFMAPAQVDKLAGIAAGATNTPLSNTAPPSIAAASAAGTLTEASRADHTHAHGSQAGGALHTLATGGAGPAGFMAPAQVDKLASIQTGATRGGQGILLHADRTASLIASSIVGCDGQVVLFSSDVVPEVATISGTAQDFTLEANTNTPGPVTISIFRAPSGSVTYVLTGVLLSLATGTRAATSALSFAVNRGDRIVALSNAVWAHGGLTIRGRILP